MADSKKRKMWAILLRLGVNTNAKPGDCRPYEMEDEYRYHESLFCDKDTWRKVTEYFPTQGINTVVIDINEGVKLDSHPELSVPGSWEKEEFKEELRRLRTLGLTPIPKFNFSCARNAWLKEYAYQIGTETYQQVCEDIVRETIEIFEKPEFFHLGLDSEDASRQQYSPVRIERSWKQKTEDTNSELRFSKHAANRLADRKLSLSDSQLDRLAQGAKKAGEKGIRESLVMVDQLAFIVNVPNNTVITAMDQTQASENIFTNIDGAVIV